MNVIPLHEARHDREVRELRDALRTCGDIARRAIRGHGENRMNALLTIDRVTATKLNETR